MQRLQAKCNAHNLCRNVFYCKLLNKKQLHSHIVDWIRFDNEDIISLEKLIEVTQYINHTKKSRRNLTEMLALKLQNKLFLNQMLTCAKYPQRFFQNLSPTSHYVVVFLQQCGSMHCEM